ncbi:MAG TPA: hypothetical protein PK593_05025 [Thermomicrobiales bacterium]|nr:hypothetical protein [Thermomicrobiales bacterium]
MLQQNLLYLFLILGAIWTAIWLAIVFSVGRVAPEPAINAKTAMLRKRLVFPIGVVLLVGLAVSMYWMPYPSVRGRTLGQPEMTVKVSAVQWAWDIGEKQLPANTRIEFELTTVDVNHNFAIYSPDGVLLTQAQVMPGYTNKLIFEFDKPGTHTVRCLEYCGIWHQIMVAVLTIV